MNKSSSINHGVSVLLIFLFIIITYGHTLQASFHFDDYLYIVNKPEIRDLSNLKAIYRALGHPSRFVSFLSFALNYHFHQFDVFGYHVVNILIHFFNGLLVYWLVNIWKGLPLMRRVGNNLQLNFVPLCCALLFVVHPIQTEAITYIVQRFTSLATFFYLLALVMYLKARGSKQAGQGAYYLCFVAATILGMFTKQICFTIPIMILCMELCLLNDKLISFLRYRWKSILILVLMLLIIPSFFGFDYQSIVLREFSSRSHTTDILNSKTYSLTQIRVLVTYLRLLVFPVGQTLDYDYPASRTFFEPQVLFSFLFLLGIFWAVVWLFKRERLVAFGILWFFITIVVTSSIIPIPHVIFEHRVYLPSIGIIFAFVLVAQRLIKRHNVFIGVMLAIILILSVLTYQRNKVWQTDISLWEDIVHKAPNKVRVYNNLGMAYLEKKEYQKSIGYFNTALQMNPNAARVYNNRGLAYIGSGEIDMALQDYKKGIDLYLNSREYKEQKIKPNWAELFNNRGNIYVKKAQYDLAMADYESAFSIDAKNERILYNMGYMYEMKGELKQAVHYYEKAIKVNPEFIKPYIGLGFVLHYNHKYAAAIKYFDQALKRDSQSGEAYFYRAAALYALDQKSAAYLDMKRSVALGYEARSQELKNLRTMILKLGD